MVKKNITISELAVMVQNGFTGIYTKMDEGVYDLKSEMGDLRKEMGGLKQRMTGLENRMDIFSNHERRLTKVEKVLKLKSV